VQVIKRDGTTVTFNPNKIRKWITWAVSGLENKIDAEHYLLKNTLGRLPERVTTDEIHQTMISVCLDKEDIMYSRVASLLEKASIYKNLEHFGFIKPQDTTFTELWDFFVEKDIWARSTIFTLEQEKLVNDLYIELEAADLEYWVVKQWIEKYSKSCKLGAIETPAMGAIANAIGLHGVTQLAFDVARDIVYGKLNLPTPALNGIRDGNFDTISCCVIVGGDTIQSIDAAELLASGYTSKKAGIGMMLNTRSKGDSVKNGSTKHLGKAPLYSAIEKSVKKYTQLTRGGSCTMNFRALDPEIQNILLWKTQRIDIQQRIDKIDYCFVYNDSFVRSVLKNEDWYLFSQIDAPELHDNFHSKEYDQLLRQAVARGVPYKKVKALEVLVEFLKSRWETGRIYCLNATRSNEHTPFTDPILQTNLCAEINLPTKPFYTISELFDPVYNPNYGEVAFCALAALNVSNIELTEYMAVAERALRTVDRMIELAPGLYPQTEASMRARRSAGIGITGLASFLYKQGLDYDGSYDSLVAVEQLSYLHYYSLLRASQKMSKETGFQVDGVNLDWLPIDTAKFVTDFEDWDYHLDYESLRGVPRMHSVLTAHMPTESSAVFSNATNGLYPSRSKTVYKKARTGRVQFISEYYDNSKVKVWDAKHMHLYYGAIQNSTDQGISPDYYTDYTKYPGMKIPVTELIKWFIDQWAAGNKSAYYQVFKDTEVGEVDCSSCKL
jgi:ribonucleoside-diphosphate reductase alpha chain